MTDEELLEIELELIPLAQRFGVPEILDDSLYRVRDSIETAEMPLSTRMRVVEKIRALERLLSIHDLNTYHLAIGNIELAMQNSHPDLASQIRVPIRAVVSDDDTELFAFENLLDLSEARELLRSLVLDLEEQ